MGGRLEAGLRDGKSLAGVPGALSRGLVELRPLLHPERNAGESLDELQTRLQEQLEILRTMYEKEGWGAKPLMVSTVHSTEHSRIAL